MKLIKKVFIVPARLFNLLMKYSMSPEAYARKIGVKIGHNCYIATRLWSSEPYLVTIGDNVLVTRGVAIHTHGGGNSVRRIIPDFDTFGKVIIDDGAYIGNFSQIMPGVRIGKNALVAAGSVVTKSVSDGMVVGGNPAKIIGTIEEYIDRNNKFNIHTKGLSAKKKKEILISLDENKFVKKSEMVK